MIRNQIQAWTQKGYPSEPRKDTIRLDKTDTEMRELLICLIAQNKEQQVQIKAMNLKLKEVLVL